MGGQPSHSHSGGHRDRNRHGNRGSANRACDTSGRRRNNNDNNVNNNNDANDNGDIVINGDNNGNNDNDTTKAAGPAAWLARLGLAGWLRGLPA